MTPASGRRRAIRVALVATPADGIDGRVERRRRRRRSTSADVRRIESTIGPRWVWWSAPSVGAVLGDVRDRPGVGPRRRAPPAPRRVAGRPGARVGAGPRSRSRRRCRRPQPPDLFDQGPTPAELAEPIGPDGHLRPEWPAGEWSSSADARRDVGRRWRCEVATAQQAQLSTLAADHPQALATARAESAAEVLCVELGPRRPARRPRRGRGDHRRHRRAPPALGRRGRRPARRRATPTVLRHAPAGTVADLRNPAQVRSLLRRVGVEVPDTRAWRLEQVRDAHPVVEALLAWRRIERTATTYGYGWLDEHVGDDGRLRGQWTGSRRRGRADDGDGRAAQPARRPAPGRRRRAGPRLRPRRPRPDRAARPRRGVRRRRPRRGRRCTDDLYAPVAAAARRRPADGEGRRARRDVRPDDRARRPGAAPARGRLPGGDGATSTTPTSPARSGATSARTAAG